MRVSWLACVRGAALLAVVLVPLDSGPQTVAAPPALAGQTATLLPDGRWLLLGGEGPGGAVDTAAVWDARTGLASPLAQALHYARAWHSATVMPDGSVLVLGGLRDGRVVETVERIWPAQSTVEDLGVLGPAARAGHTATLLTDGRVLLAGGRAAASGLVEELEVWTPGTGDLTVVGRLVTPRWRHAARLLASGGVVLWGGLDAGDATVAIAERYDPVTQSLAVLPAAPPPDAGAPALAASLPSDGATDVPPASIVSLRFAPPIDPATVSDQSVFLTGPRGPQAAQPVAAEGGRLVFLTPDAALELGSRYTVTLSGVADAMGRPVPFTTVAFATAGPPPTAMPGGPPSAPPSPPDAPGAAPGRDEEDWDPSRAERRPDWRHGGPQSHWQDLPPLEAEAGVTALAGQVLKLNGDPLQNVALIVDGRRTRTDRTGRFLLRHVPAGHQELLIDGHTANRPGRTYGVFEVGVDLADGRTTVLPYTIWMPKLDTAHAVRIPSPTTDEVVVTTPRIPGLELRIPPGTVIRDHEGRAVRELSITPIPLDRPPFPLAPGVVPPAYFTIQPGGAYLYNPSHRGARLVYPNTGREPFGERFHFWHYDPGPRGWQVYGHGAVTRDEHQIVPDPGIGIYEFTGAMTGSGGNAPNTGPKPGSPGCCEPVSVSTGIFVTQKNDLVLPDVLPIVLTRTYRPADARSRAFGRGATHPYDMYLVSDAPAFTWVDLVLPDGGRIHYDRISPEIILEHTTTPTRFYKSRLAWNAAAFMWDLTFTDGTVWNFREGAGTTRPEQTGLLRMRDRFGNTLTATREPSGALTRITTPHGRWVAFTYDASYRITQAQDNAGRTVSYTYDSDGRLWKVTDAAGGVTEYTYDSAHRMLTIKDPRGIVFLTNEYDANDRTIRQTQADGTTFEIAYTVDGAGKVTQADVTDPRGFVERYTFNADGYPLTHVRALGQPEQQTTTYEREAGTNFVAAVIDPLGRRTAFTYDANRNVTSVTRLAGTPDAVTTTYTYELTFNQMTSVTDPLNHTTTFGYDSQGRLTSVTNPLNHETVISLDTAGRLVGIQDPLGHITQITYEAGDLVAIADPLGNTTRRFVDGAGRMVAFTDPLGRTTRRQFDPLGRLTQVIDANGGLTAFTYDGNGNRLSMTDTKSNVTSYTYNNMDRRITRTDPLTRQESYQYDGNGNLAQFTDRKSQVTTLAYDALNRPTQATYADNSTSTYTYDAGDRVTTIADSIGGTIGRAYDGLDRLTQETAPEGGISYTYDGAGRRTGMTVAGQPAVGYGYDNADHLTSITHGSASVGFGYDPAARRTSLTLPNGIVVEYAYDPVSRLTGLTYKFGPATLGTLAYAHDAAGERTQVGGTWARTGVPQPVATVSYNANNQQLVFGGATMTFDLNGNLATRTDSSGTTTYTWNARNQLTALSGPSLAATFGYDGLGRRRTKSINGARTDFLYDDLNPVQEGVLPGTPSANLLTGLGIDEYLTRTDAAGALHVLPDTLGSTLALADALGAVSTEYTYEPFGVTTANGASSVNSFQFTGREADGTGLYYYRARYYDPMRARFGSEDPLRLDSGDPNFYAYVGNSPVTFTDPLGEASNGNILGIQPDAVPVATRLAGAVAGGIAAVVGCEMFPGLGPPMNTLLTGGSGTVTIGFGLAMVSAGASGPGIPVVLVIGGGLMAGRAIGNGIIRVRDGEWPPAAPCVRLSKSQS
jgi:RHS repeat-associated protein